MIVYWDLVLLLNIGFDFILLLTVNNILKRGISLSRIFFGSLVGGTSFFFLFFPIKGIFLFLFKLGIAVLMLLVTFSYQNFRYFIRNLFYLYVVSILLGGVLYYLKLEVGYTHIGLSFLPSSYRIPYVLLLVFCPISLYFYVHQLKEYRNHYASYYRVLISFASGIKLTLTGFYDTGNKLVDPYFGKGILLVPKDALKEVQIRSPIYVPYRVLNHESILTCIKPEYILIDGRKNDALYIGLSEDDFGMDGVKCIFGPKIMEGLK